jgi:cytochrome c-type biogenesis protein
VSGAPAGPVLYSFSLGLVGAVNPCGFPLLPAYLVISAAEARSAPLALRLLRALGSGLSATAGFLVVFGSLGVLITVGLQVAMGWVPWVMVPVGAACLVVGALAAAGRPLPIRLSARALPVGRNRTLTFLGFGVAYAVASLSCALPVFLAGVADSFTRRGLGVGLTAGAAYALGMGLVICALSLAGAGAHPVRARRLRAAQPTIDRLVGGVLALVGAYVVLYWVGDLVSPFTETAPVRAVENVQNHVSIWLSGSPRLAGAVIGGAIVAVLAAGCLRSLHDQRRLGAAEPADVAHAAPSPPTVPSPEAAAATGGPR